jgi:hypothetical protein
LWGWEPGKASEVVKRGGECEEVSSGLDVGAMSADVAAAA